MKFWMYTEFKLFATEEAARAYGEGFGNIKEIDIIEGGVEIPETPKPYESVKCPDCGGEMISRSGQYGMFWGCKKFPNCRGTRDSQGRSKAERDALRAVDSDDSNESSTRSVEERFNWNKK